jgi:DNA polymerase-3 subunit epsilon
MRQIVLDTETTGLRVADNHRMIEIGCVVIENRKITEKYYHQYINPKRPVDEAAFAIHGLSNQFLEDKPIFTAISEEFMAFIDGAELIIHNAPFDLGFINNELQLTQKKWPIIESSFTIIDTLVLARQLHMGQRNSLDALCKRYKIDNSQRNFHGALLDAHLLAQVYLAMTGGQGSLFDEINIKPAKVDLSNAGRIGGVAAAPIKKSRKLIVLKATPEELALHEKM